MDRQFDPKLHLTDLEQRLAQPDGADVKRALLARLQDLEERLSGQVGRMLPKDQFAVASASLEAARAARRVLAEWPIAFVSPQRTSTQLPGGYVSAPMSNKEH